MSELSFSLDLADLEVDELAVAPRSAIPGLENLPAGNSMTEVGASAIGPWGVVCSCCCCGSCG